MAGKKPAKKNVSNSVKEIKIELPGKAVMYMGMKGSSFTCPSCNKSVIKGIIWEHNSSAYCTRACISKEPLIKA